MLIAVGEKLHVMYRAYFEKSTRRHFIGEVTAVEGAACRLEGFIFIYDDNTTEFIRREEKRITIIDVAESGFVAHIIDPNVVLDEVRYRYAPGVGLIATDGKEFSLNINEFGAKS